MMSWQKQPDRNPAVGARIDAAANLAGQTPHRATALNTERRPSPIVEYASRIAPAVLALAALAAPALAHADESSDPVTELRERLGLDAPPLHEAVRQGDLDEVERLLREGADVDVASEAGWTPLHRAALEGHAGIAERLLAAGAEINASNDLGVTPLRNAAYGGHAGIVRRLVDAGADVNAADGNGLTALHWAAGEGHDDVVKLLLGAGADVAASSAKGETPLERAVKRERAGVIRVLADKGNDPQAQIHLARMYLHGAGVDRDYARARDWLERAAGSGDVQAQILLAEFLTQGPDDLRDGAQALEWLEKAARPEAGRWRVEAWYRMGVIHAEGIGVERNPGEALGLLRLAADKFHPGALYALGVMHVQGSGVPADPEQGVEFLRRAARLGNPMAPLALGTIYTKARNADRYAGTAFFWFTVAERMLPEGPQRQQAEQARNSLSDTLAPEQRERVQARAAEWLAEHR